MSWRTSTQPILARRFLPLVAMVLVLALMAAVGVTAVQAQAQEGYGAGMKAGRAAYQADDWAAAQRGFEAALAAAENDRQKSSALYALGVVAQKQNKLPEAKQRAEQALALNPNDKSAKGLLDEVNAAPPSPAAKGKGKAAPQKGLVKTPLAPPNKKPAAPVSADAAKKGGPKGDPAKPSAPKSPAKAVAPGEAPPLPPTAPPAGRSGALPSDQVPIVGQIEKLASNTAPVSTGAVVLHEAGNTASTAALSSTSTLQQPATPIVTGALQTSAAKPEDAPPAALALLASSSRAPAEAPLPVRARYVEMACGVDYRADDKFFARAYEITRAGDAPGADTGEILMFDLACESKAQAGAKPAHVPSNLIAENRGGAIVRTALRRALEGGWTFTQHQDHRQLRIRMDAETLTVVPSAAEVAVLRKKLAENPAQLEQMAPDARRNLELAVSGEGFPEFRAVRAADKLDAQFDKARQTSRRLDLPAADASSAVTVSTRTN